MKKVVLGQEVEIPDLKSIEDIRKLANDLGAVDFPCEAVEMAIKAGTMDSYGAYSAMTYSVRTLKDIENVEINSIEDFRDYVDHYKVDLGESVINLVYNLYEVGFLSKADLIMGTLKNLAEQEKEINLKAVEG